MPKLNQMSWPATLKDHVSPKVWVVGAGGRVPMDSLEALQAVLLEQRGLSKQHADSFFAPQWERDLHDPLLLHDIERAVERIIHAIKKKQRIIIHGDYDVDGLTATALLTSVLRSLGATVVPFIPHRLEHGYGLNLTVLHRLVTEFDLIITLDCGVSNVDEVAWLNTQHKDTIIIDHHTFASDGRLPAAAAVVHPRHPDQPYPFPWLCGAGVTWKVCQALLSHTVKGSEAVTRQLLDLAVLGTIADMVPLTGENRTITHYGLGALRDTVRPGLRALMQKARLGDDFDADVLAWRLIPRLNAAGKIDHAQPALDLLLATDDAKVDQLLYQLELLNTRRQTETTQVLSAAERQVGDSDSPLIFAADHTWPAGVVGLVASRLSEKFARPAVVIGGNGQHAVGSARSPVSVNILEILQAGKEHFLKFGGHARAAGFSVATDKISLLRDTLISAALNVTFTPEKTVYADTCIESSLINWNLLHQLERFAPFGEGNRRPVFIAQGLRLVGQRAVGKTKQHSKCTFLLPTNEFLDGIGFGLAGTLPPGSEYVDVMFNLERNTYGNRQSLQLRLQDIAQAGKIKIRENV